MRAGPGERTDQEAELAASLTGSDPRHGTLFTSGFVWVDPWYIDIDIGNGRVGRNLWALWLTEDALVGAGSLPHPDALGFSWDHGDNAWYRRVSDIKQRERYATRSKRDRTGMTLVLIPDAEAVAYVQRLREEKEAADVSVLREMLRAGKPFFGQARSSGRDYPFQIDVDSFDEGNGHCTGTMNYYSPDDRSVLTFEGALEGSVFSLAHTGVRKQGRMKPDWQYTVRVANEERLVGHYSKKGSTYKTGEVWIDLDESRREKMENKLAELRRIEATEELRAKEEEAQRVSMARAPIVAALKSGNPFFGKVKIRFRERNYPLQINFESFDEGNGHCTGTMNYYSPDDKSVLTFEGTLEGTVLSLAHTGVRKQGWTTPDWQYTLRVGDNEGLVGHYCKKDATYKEGEIWIDLNEARREEMETKVAELLRLEALKEEASTATKEVLVLERPAISNPSQVILTDVGIKGTWSRAEDLLYFQISKFDARQDGKRWRVLIEGRSKNGRTYRRQIDFPDKAGCEAFYNAVSEAYDAWKTKYAEILTPNGEKKSSG